MGTISQIYSLVNAAASDFLGSTAVRAKDTSSFVDLGRQLGDIFSETNPYAGYDSFYGALACRIAKTEVFTRMYERAERGVITDYQEFGAFVQKVYADVPDAVSNPTWALSNGENPPTITAHSPYAVTNTISISAMIYGKRGTWSYEVVMPYKQVKEAFLSESAMMAFIDSIYIQISTKLNIDLENLENLAVATSIANCIENGKSTNLLKVYNDSMGAGGVSLTVSNCLKSLDFLAFANKTIDNMRGYIKKPSRKYNTAGYMTFTPADRAKLEVLTDFASASKFYLESNTYHDELVKMEGYSEVPYWQSPGTSGDFDFAESSKIIIANEGIKKDAVTGAPVTVTGTGILAFMRDEENVKAYFGELRSWTVPNPRDDSTIHGEKAEMGYAVDPHANAWVFYIAEA